MESKIDIIEEKYGKEEAIERKLKKLVPKLFGIPISKYILLDATKVFVPFYFVQYSYRMTIKNNVSSKLNIHERKVGIVVDSVEGRSYVVEADEKITLKKISVDTLDGEIISGNFSEQQLLEKSYEYLRWRVIAKVYREVPEIIKTKQIVFYRSMWKMKLLIWGKEMVKMAPADDYETSKQSLKGLKK